MYMVVWNLGSNAGMH